MSLVPADASKNTNSSLRILTGLFRDGVWTSYLGFEFAWLTILWILWLTGGGLNATYFRSGANIYTTALEEQVQVVSGFCFLIWMMRTSHR